MDAFEDVSQQQYEFPIGTSIIFRAIVTTQFGTSILSKAPSEISWDFGDGRNSTSLPYQHVLIRTYRMTGNFNLSISLVADFSLVETELVTPVRVYQRKHTWLTMLCYSSMMRAQCIII